MISIEDAIIKSLVYDEVYARKIMPHLEDQYFEGVYKNIFKVYKKLFEEYNKIPTLDAIGISLQNSTISEQDFEGVYEVVESIVKTKKDVPDSEWLFNETEQYCKDKALFDALSKAVSIVDDKDTKFEKGMIPDILEEALSISFQYTVGMDYFDDAGRRYDAYTAVDARLPFPLKALQILSNGGHKKKALSCVLGTTNTGKSAIMCYLAGEFLKQGKNVLYISLEMSEEDVTERIDAQVLDVRTDDLKKLSKKEFISKVNKIKEKTVGRLIVKEYPTGSGSASHFEALCKELKQKKKFEPDMIFIDYINICASSRYKSLGGVNSYSYIKAIAEEIRAMAMRLDTCIMTGTQINREGSNNAHPGMENTSDCLAKDTLVNIKDKGDIELQNVQVGDLIRSHDGYKVVRMVHCPKVKKSYRIKTKSGKEIICSADHKIPAKDKGRVCINSGLSVGDRINTL